MLFNIKRNTKLKLKTIILTVVSIIFWFYIIRIFLRDPMMNEIILSKKIIDYDQINDQLDINVNHIPKAFTNPPLEIKKTEFDISIENLDNVKNDNFIYPPLEINKKELDMSIEDLDNLKQITYLIDDNISYKNIFDLIDDINVNYPSFTIEVILWHNNVFKININSNVYILKRLFNNELYDSNDLVADQFDSPNIVKILGSFSRNMGINQSYTWFISEYLDVPVDSDYIINGTMETLRKITVDLLNGLSALHKENVVHGDIYVTNVCGKTEEDGTVTFKLIDFGMAKMYNDKNSFIKVAQQDFARFEELLMDIVENMKNFNNFSELEKKKFLDFRLVAGGFTENMIKDIQDLFNHPFITDLPLDIENDKFGKRKEYQYGKGFFENTYF